MTTAEDPSAIGLVAIPRAVLSAAAGVYTTMERAMVGDSRVRTARSNAWDAICADQARAQARAEMARLIAALATTGPGSALRGPAVTAQLTVGSSPRSSASQADLVSIGADSRR